MKGTLSECDNLVSVLNALVENMGYDVAEIGFGYDNNGELSMADGDTFSEGIEWLWSERKQWSNKEHVMNDYDKILKELEDYGSVCIDWGVTGDIYKNCPSKAVADDIANKLKSEGYYVYIHRMGKGKSSISEGTPVCYRVYDFPSSNTTWEKF